MCQSTCDAETRGGDSDGSKEKSKEESGKKEKEISFQKRL
jgi:hypothetical protein